MHRKKDRYKFILRVRFYNFKKNNKKDLSMKQKPEFWLERISNYLLILQSNKINIIELISNAIQHIKLQQQAD